MLGEPKVNETLPPIERVLAVRGDKRQVILHQGHAKDNVVKRYFSGLVSRPDVISEILYDRCVVIDNSFLFSAERVEALLRPQNESVLLSSLP